MKTAHRYVFQEMMPYFFLSVAVLTFLFMINKIFVLLDLVINKKVPLGDTLVLYFSLVPFVLSLTIPMSMMVATLLAFGRLSSDMEITAFKSSGVHIFNLIFPVLLFGFVMTLGMLYHEVIGSGGDIEALRLDSATPAFAITGDKLQPSITLHVSAALSTRAARVAARYKAR